MSTNPIVLFLCTGNSCRSQMAEGFLREFGGNRFESHSAGTEPKAEVHPLAVQVMAERDVDISRHSPKDVSDYLGRLPVKHLIVVCHDADGKCPRIFPGILSRTYWPIDDPATFVGPPEDVLAKFREVRDEIETRIKQWLTENP